MIKNLFLLALVLTLTFTNCFAYTGKVVKIYRWHDNQYYNVSRIYTMPIRYFIASRLEHFTYEYDGQSYTYNFAPDIEQALALWSEVARGVPNAPVFTRVNRPPEMDLFFGVAGRPPPDVPEDTPFYSYPRSEERDARIMFVSENISQSLQQGYPFFREVYPFSDYVRLFFRIAVIHEVGHVMGFHHPDADATESDSHPLELSSPDFAYFTVNGPDYNVSHVMTGNLITYLTERQLQLGRPVGLSDIIISPVEAALFTHLLRASTPTCLSSSAFSRRAAPAVLSNQPQAITCRWGSPPAFGALSLLLN